MVRPMPPINAATFAPTASCPSGQAATRPTFLNKTGHLDFCTATALVGNLCSKVVHPVLCGLEIPTLDLVYKGCNCGVRVYRHSGRVA